VYILCSTECVYIYSELEGNRTFEQICETNYVYNYRVS